MSDLARLVWRPTEATKEVLTTVPDAEMAKYLARKERAAPVDDVTTCHGEMMHAADGVLGAVSVPRFIQGSELLG